MATEGWKKIGWYSA